MSRVLRRLLLAVAVLGSASRVGAQPANGTNVKNAAAGFALDLSDGDRWEGVLPVGASGKPLNLDFETGTLQDWTAQGAAFAGQPVDGDTVAARRNDMQSRHHGRFWVGTFERGGDEAQGTLISAPFKVTHPWASFLIAGGSGSNTRVELVRRDNGNVVAQRSSCEEETMRRAVVHLASLHGREIFIRLVDQSSDGWGHINFDNFRFHNKNPGVELTEVARQFPRDPGPTSLFVNFDGEATGQTITEIRDETIQDVLFRIAEFYAPFDVEVRRISGKGRFIDSGGHATLFIGAHPERQRKNETQNFADSLDAPGREKGAAHRPNSDRYHIARVSPMDRRPDGVWEYGGSVIWMSEGGVHEIGHSFGLNHVIARARRDVMALDDGQGPSVFLNQPLPITDLGDFPTGRQHLPCQEPYWRVQPRGGGSVDVPITAQNSYTYLMAVLGARPHDGLAHVADGRRVDPAYALGTMPEIQPGAQIRGTVRRHGDYLVHDLKSPTDQFIKLAVRRTVESKLDPVALVYGAAGQLVLSCLLDSGSRPFQIRGGESCKVVVGARDGATLGDFQLSVAPIKIGAGVLPTGGDGKPLNLDFETGNLKDWVAAGDAFKDQPVEGDTVAARRSDMKSRHQGRYWIGGCELAGDEPKGTLTSVSFRVTRPWATFLVGGGGQSATRVELARKDTGAVFASFSGTSVEDMSRILVDVQPLRGKEMFVRIVDQSSGGWGHINFDDFRFHE